MEKIYIRKSFIKNKDTKTYIMSNGLVIEKHLPDFISISSKQHESKDISYSNIALDDLEMVEIINFLNMEWNQMPFQIALGDETSKWKDSPNCFTIDVESNGMFKKIYLLNCDPKEENNFEEYETHVQYDSQENDYSHELLQELMYA